MRRFLNEKQPADECDCGEYAAHEQPMANVVWIIQPVLEQNDQNREDQKILRRQNSSRRQFTRRQFEISAHERRQPTERNTQY